MMDPLVAQLSRLLQSRPESVEVLPSEWASSPSNPHQPFEFTENHLGIPKGVYYKVYSKAIQNLNQLLSQGDQALQTTSTDEVLDTTSVVLLVNPAHGTCLNMRKELVLGGKWSEQQELQITAALQLQSDGAKSSILWHHRRWLLCRLYPPSSGSSAEEDDGLERCRLPLDAISSEIAVVTTACEIYHRNYHAWLHRYKCLRSLASTYRAIGTTTPTQSKEVWAQMLRAEEFALKKWIELNVTDYTAMQYLCHVYSTMEELAVKHIQLHAEEEDEVNETSESNPEKLKMAFSPVDHAIDLIKRYPTHEALWYYLRVGYATARVPKQDGDVLGNLRDSEGVYVEHFERWRKHWDSPRGVPTIT